MTRFVEPRLIAAMLVAVVFAVAMLGATAPMVAAAAPCQHATCTDLDLPPDADADATAVDPCLHDHACGGGGALQLGAGLEAAPGQDLVVPSDSGSQGWMSPPRWRPNAAELTGGVERPPRAD